MRIKGGDGKALRIHWVRMDHFTYEDTKAREDKCLEEAAHEINSCVGTRTQVP